MNEEYIKEYEEMSLCDFADELVEPLCTIKKDLTKTIYIHYAEERDKNYELEQENARLKDKIEKVIEYVNHYESIKGYYEYEECGYDEYNYEEDLKEKLLELLK